ncbi:mammalian cell entry protein, partial [Salmonella enterica]|nr:mammalian cell entry protein [Salmonella enterica]
MPTIPGSLDKLQDQVQRIVEKLSKIPVERIADNLNANLVEMRKTLQQVNGQVLPQMRDAL